MLESNKINDAIKHSDETIKNLDYLKIVDALRLGEIYRVALLERSKFKVNDSVILTATPEISNNVAWGWLGSKHFLVKGAKARVAGVDFSKNQFCYWLEFEDDSYIDSSGKIVKKLKKAQYYFSENFIDLYTNNEA